MKIQFEGLFDKRVLIPLPKSSDEIKSFEKESVKIHIP